MNSDQGGKTVVNGRPVAARKLEVSALLQGGDEPLVVFPDMTFKPELGITQEGMRVVSAVTDIIQRLA
jgi:hypothetical protein